MSFILDPEKEKRDREVRQSGVVSSNTAASPSPAPQAPGVRATPESQRQSGTFTNLQKYLKANEGQGAGLGNKISEDIGNQTNQVKTDLNTAKDQFTQQANQANDAYFNDEDKQTIDKVTADVGTGITAQSQTGNVPFNPQTALMYSGPTDAQGNPVPAAPTPEEQAAKDAETQRLKTLTTAQYGGPTQLDVSAQQAKEDNLKQRADQLGTEAGRFAELGQTFKKDNYTGGQKNLDQLILQNDESGRQSLAGAQQNVQTNLVGQSAQTAQAANAVATANQQRIDQERTALNQKINDAEQIINSAQSSQAEKLAAQAQKNMAELNTALTNRSGTTYNLNPDTYKLIFGRDSQPGQNLSVNAYGITLNDPKYIKPAALTGDPEKDFIATISPSQLDALNRFRAVQGLEPIQVPEDIQPGSFTGKVTYDTQALSNDVDAKVNNFQKIQSTPIGYSTVPVQNPVANIQLNGAWRSGMVAKPDLVKKMETVKTTGDMLNVLSGVSYMDALDWRKQNIGDPAAGGLFDQMQSMVDQANSARSQVGLPGLNVNQFYKSEYGANDELGAVRAFLYNALMSQGRSAKDVNNILDNDWMKNPMGHTETKTALAKVRAQAYKSLLAQNAAESIDVRNPFKTITRAFDNNGDLANGQPSTNGGQTRFFM